MKRFWMAVAAGVLCLGMKQARAELEARIQMMGDPVKSDQSSVGGLIGLGAPVSERLTLGGYGYLIPTDRDQPAKMDRINGLGVFADFDLSEGYDLMPFVGARAGFLSASGPGYPTASNLAGTLGVKYRLTDKLTAAFSVNYLWASEAYYDYKRLSPSKPGDAEWKAESTALTLDLGIRWLF